MYQRNKRITSSFIFLSLLLIGVVYAILQANLQINGVAKIQSNTWDIHFDNIQVNENSVSIGTGDSAATIDPENNCKVDFEVTLSLPGDFYEFTIDVVNAGTIDGMVGELNKTLRINNEVVSEVPDYLIYSVTYDDGNDILEDHLLSSGSLESYKVLLKFNDEIEELPEAATISTSLEPQYLQADNSAFERPVTTLIDGKSFNARIKKLSGTNNAYYYNSNSNITAFRKSDTPPDMNSMTNDNIVSVTTDNPIYAWFDDGTIYYYSEANIVYLNEDSSYMFNELVYCSVLEMDSINASRSTNMSHMFYRTGYYATSFSTDLSHWNTLNVTDMESLFHNTGNLATTWEIGDLSNWNTSKVTKMNNMFNDAGQYVTVWNVGNLSNWDTSNVTDMSWMFCYAGYKATSFNIGNLSNWKTSKVTNMESMFFYCGSMSTTWYIGDLSNWNTSNVTSMYNMFGDAAYKATSFDIGNLSNWNTSKVTNMAKMFYDSGNSATTWYIGDLSNWKTSNVTTMERMFCEAGRLATTWSIGDLSNWNTSKVTSMSYMFYCAGVASSTFNIGDLSNWNTSNVTTMSYMFDSAGKNATTWNSIGTLKVYANNIQSMFEYCANAKATLKIYNNPSSYMDAFRLASTVSGSGITVDYTSNTSNIDNIIASKTYNSNVVKGNMFTP